MTPGQVTTSPQINKNKKSNKKEGPK